MSRSFLIPIFITLVKCSFTNPATTRPSREVIGYRVLTKMLHVFVNLDINYSLLTSHRGSAHVIKMKIRHVRKYEFQSSCRTKPIYLNAARICRLQRIKTEHELLEQVCICMHCGHNLSISISVLGRNYVEIKKFANNRPHTHIHRLVVTI